MNFVFKKKMIVLNWLKPLKFKKLQSFLNYYKAPILSGFLFGFSFIPFPFFLLFFCLVPFWFFIYHQTQLKKIIIACLLCQSIGTFIGFNWIFFTFQNFAGMNDIFSFLLLIGFCLFANMYILFSGCLWFFLTRKRDSFPLIPPLAKLLLLPLIFSILHAIIPTLFPWNMGYTWLWGGLPGFQTAEIWGFRFLNTLFYVFNLLLLIVYKHRLDKIGKTALATAFTLFACLNFFGMYLKWRLPKTDSNLNIILVQNNVGSIFHLQSKPFRSSSAKAFYISKTLTYRSILKYVKTKEQQNDIHFIIWSEGSYAYTIDKNLRYESRLSKLAKTIKIPLITGAVGKDYRNSSNSLFVFDRKGEILKPVYDKIKLVFFGEYFPLIQNIPSLRKIFPYFGSNFTPGKTPQVQELEGVRFGWQICYESLFDSLSRELANKKAQVFVNITNDSWYGDWQQPLQHLTMNFSRAIEFRRPLIRATNTGHSGVIQVDGKISEISPMNKTWFQLYKVPYYKNPPKTLFMSWGYYINEFFLILLAICICFFSFRSRFKN